MNVLVFNVGSTTLKYGCLDPTAMTCSKSGIVDRIGQPGGDAQTHIAAAQLALADVGLENIQAIGHRIVQGGAQFQSPTLVDPETLRQLKKLDVLAPLHNPAARAVVESLVDVGIPQVLVFDTAYFSTLAPEAYRYAVPDQWYHEYGVRRYGFHGTSHQYVTARALEFAGGTDQTRVISLHLGGGASVTASVGGVAVDTSMGMTPLEGLVMATRCGDIDAAVVHYVVSCSGQSLDEVDATLNRQSGLLGLCGESDMRAILARRAEGDSAASLAVDIYVRKIVKTVGGFYAILGGIDLLVFTAGIGEHSHEIRALVGAALEPLGVKISDAENRRVSGEASEITADGARVRTLVMATNEELAIAQQVAAYQRNSS